MDRRNEVAGDTLAKPCLQDRELELAALLLSADVAAAVRDRPLCRSGQIVDEPLIARRAERRPRHSCARRLRRLLRLPLRWLRPRPMPLPA